MIGEMTKKKEQEYLDKWFPRIERMRALGFKVHGFDPGMTVFPADDHEEYCRTVMIEPWMLVILEDIAVRLFPETADDKAMLKRREKRVRKEEIEKS